MSGRSTIVLRGTTRERLNAFRDATKIASQEEALNALLDCYETNPAVIIRQRIAELQRELAQMESPQARTPSRSVDVAPTYELVGAA